MKFKSYTIGCFHIDIAKVQTVEGNWYLFGAIERTFRFAYVDLHPKAITAVFAHSCTTFRKPFPCKVHTVLTEPLLVRQWFKTNGGGIQQPMPGVGGSAVPLIKAAIAAGKWFRA